MGRGRRRSSNGNKKGGSSQRKGRKVKGGAVETRSQFRGTRRHDISDAFFRQVASAISQSGVERFINGSRRRPRRRHVSPPSSSSPSPVRQQQQNDDDDGGMPDGPQSPPPASDILTDEDIDVVWSEAIAHPDNFNKPRISHNTYYVYPKAVIQCLDSIASVPGHDNVYDLEAIRVLIDRARDKLESGVVEEFTPQRRILDPINFAINELCKLLSEGNFGLAENPSMHDLGDDQYILNIPTSDVVDLPAFLAWYIIFRIAFHNSSSFFPMVTWDNIPNEFIIHGGDNLPIMLNNRYLSKAKFAEIYMFLLTQIINNFPAAVADASREAYILWYGEEDSATRIRLINYQNRSPIILFLKFRDAPESNLGGCWTQEVEDVIKASVGTSVVSVRNKNDNKCLIYCVILGLMLKIKGLGRLFGLNPFMIEDFEVYGKGTFMFYDNTEASQNIKRLTRCILPPRYSSGDCDAIYDLMDDIDKNVGTMMTWHEFRIKFREIEEVLFPTHFCGIDVYGMDYNINPYIFPLYMSKQRQHVIELLCVTPPKTRCSHFCLIMNMTTLMKKSGGKHFFSCSDCGECYFHRRLLMMHKCPKKLNRATMRGLVLDEEGGYHYSKKSDKQGMVIYGSCSKCRLSFTSEFEYEYHTHHCLMNGQSGYRHVQLVSYKDDEHPMLKGEEIDYEKEELHVKQRRVLYADFESYIDPANGEHHFMSYGLYDWESTSYRCGYDLGEFIVAILDFAFSGPQTQIYVYFHNAMGYDANFILRYVLKSPIYNKWGIQVIMKSMNRLQKLVFHVQRDGQNVRTIHIGDTFLFLTLSLERIVDSIRKDELEINKRNFKRFFNIFHRRYPWVSDDQIDHILRKNIFPYKFFDKAERLDTPIAQFRAIFEPKEENLQYFSERVGVEDLEKGYADTCGVIDVFKCINARDYHDLYLCCDVMQLADVFNRSMKILWESHHIHLTKYMGMPSASWAAFIRHDPSMRIPLYENTFFAEFFKGMIRGGVTSAPLRHAVADDKHSIVYLDVNGLYPYVMQKYPFPCGEFNFIPYGWEGESCIIRLSELFHNLELSGKGMCFCVNMEFPDLVKMKTDMYPFAPEHRRIFKEYYQDYDKKELTPFLAKWAEANEGEKMPEFNGLVCTLYNKEKYNVHWRLLKFYMEHGVKITKVWFGVSFDEGYYLAGYIRKNIEIRNTRKDELGKTLYKLLGNSIYGKTYESPFKRVTMEIVKDESRLSGLILEGNISAMTPIDDAGWIVKMDGEDIILDKPTYIGACVCEFAKLHMYTLLYDILCPIFPDTLEEKGCQLVYTDTDSFIVMVKHPEELTGCTPQQLFDYIKSKDPSLIGGIGGQVKSETGEDDTIQEVIALRSKVYAYITKNGHIGKRAKGTTHDAQELQLDWETYKRTLESLVSMNTRNVQFVRQTFKIASIDVFRQSLSVNDGKRYICEDGIHTHAFGFPVHDEN